MHFVQVSNRFTKEEAKKPAAKRLCNDCIVSGATTVKSKPKAPATSTKTSAATTNNKSVIPQLDIKCMSIKEMKEELESHNVCTKAMIEKSELIDALTNARVRSKCSSLTLVDIQALTVQGLKEELKSRGLPVSGLKAVLQQRLIDAVGVSTGATESSGKEASTEEAPVKKTVVPEKTASKEQNKENVPQTKGNDSKKIAKKESKEQNKENGLKERVKRCSGCSNILLNKYTQSTQICGTCDKAKQLDEAMLKTFRIDKERSSAGGGNGKQSCRTRANSLRLDSAAMEMHAAFLMRYQEQLDLVAATQQEAMVRLIVDLFGVILTLSLG